MEWFKSCCSAGTAAGGQPFLGGALTYRACLLPDAWKVPREAWLRTVIKVPRMFLGYRQHYLICGPLCLILRRQLSCVPKGLSKKAGSLQGWKVLRAFSSVVKLKGSQLCHAHSCAE